MHLHTDPELHITSITYITLHIYLFSIRSIQMWKQS